MRWALWLVGMLLATSATAGELRLGAGVRQSPFRTSDAAPTLAAEWLTVPLALRLQGSPRWTSSQSADIGVGAWHEHTVGRVVLIAGLRYERESAPKGTWSSMAVPLGVATRAGPVALTALWLPNLLAWQRSGDETWSPLRLQVSGGLGRQVWWRAGGMAWPGAPRLWTWLVELGVRL